MQLEGKTNPLKVIEQNKAVCGYDLNAWYKWDKW